MDKLIAGGLLGAVFFAALAHGAVEPWSVALLGFWLLALLLLWAIRMVASKRLALHVPVLAWPLVGLLVLALAQSVAWGGTGERRSLSLDVDSTRGAALMIFLMLVALLLSANFWARRARLRSLAVWLTGFGLLLAIFALVQGFSWNGRFYWVRPMGDLPSPYGPFLSHSLFAGFMELLIPIPIGMTLSRAWRGTARLLGVFAAVIMSLSLIFSLSRGGMISLAAGLVFCAALGLGRARTRARRWEGEEERAPMGSRRAWVGQAAAVGGVVALILAGLVWLGPDLVVGRIAEGRLSSDGSASETLYSSRGWVWRDAWAMARANPLTGVGLGAFGTVYPIYTLSDGRYAVPQAHNDYLQVLAEGGVIALALALWFIFLVLRAAWRGVRSRDPVVAGWALAGGAGIFSILVHSFFDFNLQIPSNVLLFLLVGAIVSETAEHKTSSAPSV